MKKMGGGGGGGEKGPWGGGGPSGKSLPKLFYPLRPFKLKKHERLVKSKISTKPYCRAWTKRERESI